MNAKQLHKHSVPIIIFSVGLFLVSVLGIGRLTIAGSHSNNSLSELLSERLLNIQPAKNGLFHISRYQNGSQTDSRLLTAHYTSTGLGVISGTGEVTILNTSLDSIAQQNQ